MRIRVLVSGVNPTDWKSRSGTVGGAPAEPTVPNQDGAGVVDKLGAGVVGFDVGDRVWVVLAGDGRLAGGTAQEYAVVPAGRVFPLPAAADFELGAGVGIPGVTAHRVLTVAEDGPARLHPGALSGCVVVVAGGAGAVGNAAIQLARWAGASVIATVSGGMKGKLAAAAGAHHVVNYKESDAAARIRDVAPDGVDVIVEVAAGANAELDQAVLRPRGTISIYANDGGAPFTLDVRRNMGLNSRWQFVLLYTVGWERSRPPPRTSTTRSKRAPSGSANTPGCRFTASPSKTRPPHTLPSRAERSGRSSSPSGAAEPAARTSARGSADSWLRTTIGRHESGAADGAGGGSADGRGALPAPRLPHAHRAAV